MTEIGATAWSWRSLPIDSARLISQARRPPAMVASTTSLTLPPWTARTLR